LFSPRRRSFFCPVACFFPYSFCSLSLVDPTDVQGVIFLRMLSLFLLALFCTPLGAFISLAFICLRFQLWQVLHAAMCLLHRTVRDRSMSSSSLASRQCCFPGSKSGGLYQCCSFPDLAALTVSVVFSDHAGSVQSAHPFYASSCFFFVFFFLHIFSAWVHFVLQTLLKPAVLYPSTLMSHGANSL